ncbi:hypothetical protein [Nakamurella lactea]|uniref:hypothetical protein n=1 Tax=Nakamurella lactea TaxID=459515 RepID=UPI00048C4FB9|nr:hypothetical protein [Nakamurella lactea]
MALPWVRLDTQISSNPKVLMLLADSHQQAVCVYLFSLGYSGAHGTDGFIPKLALPMIHGSMADAKRLVGVGLWSSAGGGWDINGWTEFQPTSDENAERKRKAKLAAHKRWHPDEPFTE